MQLWTSFTPRPERRENFENTMERLLELGALPVINENDTIATAEIKVGDNDTLGAIVACCTKADLLVLLSDIEGLYTADPRKDPDAKLIPTVEEVTPEIEALAGGVGSRRFSFASFFPSFPSLFCPDGPDAADTDASRTPFTRPSFDGPSADAVPRSVRWHTIFCRFHATRGRFAYPASMFFPGSRRNVLHSCRWAVGSFQIRECRCSLFSPPFPRPFSVEVAPSFFAAKLGCRRARPVRS